MQTLTLETEPRKVCPFLDITLFTPVSRLMSYFQQEITGRTEGEKTQHSREQPNSDRHRHQNGLMGKFQGL